MATILRRGRGFIHRPHKYHLLGAPHPTVGASSYAPAAALSGFITWTFDQGLSESCGGHGTTQLAKVSLAAQGIVLGYLSPQDIWAATRAKESAGSGPLPNVGVDPVDLITAVGEGVSLMATQADGSPVLTPDGRVSDVWTPQDIAGIPGAPPANDGNRPSLAQDEDGRRHLILGPQLIDPAASDFEDHLCSSICNDKAPVGVGIHASAAFEAWGQGGAADGKTALSDASGFTSDDGHWVGVYDYATLTSGPKIYWLANSWSKRWGTSKGGIWVTGPWLRASTMVAIQFKCSLKAAA
jgi:hypothetical protein